MANELPNAVALMRDSDFRDWVRAAACYQAASAITGGTAASRQMASEVLLNPNLHLDRLINILACRPQVCSVGADIATIGQPLLLAQVAAVWSPLADVLYPAA